MSKKRITDDIKLQKITQKLVADNYKVFFVDFATTAPHNTKPVFINIDHSLLELVHHTNFNFDDYKKRYGDFVKNSVFIVVDKDEIMNNITSQLNGIKIEYI